LLRLMAYGLISLDPEKCMDNSSQSCKYI